MTESDLTYHRSLIAAGTAKYEHLPDHARELASVAEDLVKINTLFCQTLGYERAIPELNLDPTREQFRNSLSDWFGTRSGKRDVLVIYYSGHGDVEGGRHYLLATDSDPSDLLGTALETEFLARRIASSDVRLALLLIDTCYSGVGATDITTVVQQTKNLFATANAGIFVIAAARPKQEAQQGVFADALLSVLFDERLGGERQLFLEPTSISVAINRYFRDRKLSQLCLISSTYSGYEDPPFFPNPRYRRDLPVGIDLRMQKRLSSMDPHELALHWGPRARGVEIEEQPGWYFSGRSKVLNELVKWLRTPASATVTQVVTGGPGVGKSAVLARLVTLADAGYRARAPLAETDPETIPPEGSINVALHARGKTLGELVLLLAHAAGTGTGDLHALIDVLARREEPFTVVLDALDEAKEPDAIAARLLRPLGSMAAIRLLVGTRDERNIIPNLGSRVEVRRLDGSEYHDAEALVRYVEERLLAQNEPDLFTPYRNRPHLARAVAQLVAGKADPVFLIARLACEQLMQAGEVVDLEDVEWRAALPTTVPAAFDAYLRRFGADEQRVRDLLLPLAYGEGEGLPWANLWAPLATALSGRTYTDADVAWVRRVAGAYIVEALATGLSVYRLYHQALADYFHEPEQDVERHRKMARRLASLLSDRSEEEGCKDWSEAHAYTLQHLSTHASAGGVLTEFIADPLYCLLADPLRLLVAIDRSQESLPYGIVQVYRQSVHRIRNASTLGEAASYLELVAHQEGQRTLAARIRRLPLVRKWAPKWTLWKSSTSHRVLGEHGGKIDAVTSGCADGREVVASIGGDRTVRLWDLVTGGEVLRVLSGNPTRIGSVMLSHLGERDIVISGNDHGTVRRWDTASGEPLGVLERLFSSATALALGRIGGQDAVASGDVDGLIQLWNAATGKCLGVLRGHSGHVTALALGRVGDRDFVVSGANNGMVRLWDVAGEHSLGMLKRHRGQVTAVTMGRVGTRNVIMSGGSDRTVRFWDAANGKTLTLVAHPALLTAVALGKVRGREVFVSGCDDGMVRLWDANSAQPLRVLHGHSGIVTAVAWGLVGDRDVVVSGGSDGTVRLWDVLGLIEGDPKLPDDMGAVTATSLGKSSEFGTAVALGRVGARDVVVTGSNDGIVALWDAANGDPVRVFQSHSSRRFGIHSAHRGSVRSVVLGHVGERDVLVSGSDDGTVRLWDAVSGEVIKVFRRFPALRLAVRPRIGSVRSVALGHTRERTIVVAGGADGVVRLWDATGGDRIGVLHGHSGEVTAVAIGQVGKRNVVVSGGDDGTVRLWSAANFEPIRVFKRSPDRWLGIRPGQTSCIRSVALGQVGEQNVVASGGDDGTVRLWDAAGGEALGVLQGHSSDVTAVALGSVGGRDILVSGGYDGTVRIHDARSTKPLTALRLGASIISASLYGDCLAVSTASGLSLIELYISSEKPEEALDNWHYHSFMNRLRSV